MFHFFFLSNYFCVLCEELFFVRSDWELLRLWLFTICYAIWVCLFLPFTCIIQHTSFQHGYI